jgi:uncharacterized protein (DUF885 family)
MRAARALLAAAAVAAVMDASAQDPRPAAPDARLHDLFAREWAARLSEDPLLATSVGVHDHDHRLPSVSEADQRRRAQAASGFLAELGAIDRARLSAPDRVHAAIFESQLRDGIASIEFAEYQVPFNADSGFFSDFARLPDTVPLDSLRGYESFLSRLRAWPAYVDQQIANMRAGLARGMSLPRAVLPGIDEVIGAHVVQDPEKSLFWAPFRSIPAAVPSSEHERLRQAGRAAIREAVVPGYAKLLQFFKTEYLPNARASLGASELPNGRAYYEMLVRRFTTLPDATADSVHATGLQEVARIEAEMKAVIARVGFQGDFAAFLKFLRSDPRFYPQTGEQLLKEAAWIAKRMDGKLPSLFRTLPRLPYTVAPVPDAIAPKYTAGRYVDAPVGGRLPGQYWVNTYALPSRPLYNLEALTLHEAVPGHHLQNALAQEQQDLPPFRRYSYISAFGEGWGLYSERLGLEAGFYTEPYSDFGRLTYEMWRACRLVVDTGLHAKGWTREQAMDYLASRTALSLHEVRTETDRYISWPGQALSYKIGELKIRELRRRAEQALGARFDIRDFHDAVLLGGSVPLPVLEQVVERYIAEARPR